RHLDLVHPDVEGMSGEHVPGAEHRERGVAHCPTWLFAQALIARFAPLLGTSCLRCSLIPHLALRASAHRPIRSAPRHFVPAMLTHPPPGSSRKRSSPDSL